MLSSAKGHVKIHTRRRNVNHDYPDLCMEAFTMRVRPCEHSMNDDDDDNNNGVEGALVIERRNKHLFAAFHRRNVANNNQENVNTQFGLTDTGWSNLLKRFVD